MKRAALVAACCAVVPLVAPTGAGADAYDRKVDRLSARGQQVVTPTGIKRHLRELQSIAERNGGNRASGTRGYQKSVEYVAGRLRAAGWQVSVQPFEFDFFQQTGAATLAVGSTTYEEDTDYTVMDYSGSGDVTAPIAAVDLTLPPTPEPSSTSGCEASDFADFPAGAVALIQRGTCSFEEKVDNAVAAGASAVVIFNEGQPGRTDASGGTLGAPKTVPVLFASFEVGQALAARAGEDAHVVAQTVSEKRTTYNVLADSRSGDPNQTVVIGSHLDSVVEGPGINDNGSGSAQDLEMAEELPKVVRNPRNRVIFAFWGAEEKGLLGSEHYVAQLSDDQRDQIMANLNFDMVASPNYVRFVYDGDGSDGDPGPVGSDLIEGMFERHFQGAGLASEPTAFDGRSDYGPFIDRGIPAGGLFSGAEGIKTPEQAARYGGTAGQPYDACYHEPCDSLRNVSDAAIDEFSNASTDVAIRLAMRRTPLTDNEPSRMQLRRAAAERDYRGPHAIR